MADQRVSYQTGSREYLHLSKIEAGRMELELKDFDLPQAISNAVTLVRERAGRRGIALHQAVDQRLGMIRGDERKASPTLPIDGRMPASRHRRPKVSDVYWGIEPSVGSTGDSYETRWPRA